MIVQQRQSAAVTAAFLALFRPDEPMPSRLQNVLHGTTKGQLFTDNPDKPAWGIVQEPYDGCLYLGGAPTRDVVAEVLSRLRTERTISVLLWTADPRRALLPTSVNEVSHGIDFYDRPIGRGLDPYLHAIPADCTVRRADRALIMRTQWGPDDVAYHGGLDAWEKNCICYCMLRGEEVISEASVGAGANQLYEPGVITQKAQRGEGHGTIVAAHLIREIEERGGRTYWSCDSENYASAAIARKLGYQAAKKFTVLTWHQLT